MEVFHINLKHSKRNSEILQIIPIFSVWEQQMWEYITDGGVLAASSEILPIRPKGVGKRPYGKAKLLPHPLNNEELHC